MSVYQDYAVVEGVRIHFKSSVKSWEQWPDDVRETIRRWNKSRGLTFRYMRAIWGGYATGFAALTFKCVRCDGFFNSSGSTACELKGCLYCDDCIIDMARAA